MKNMTYALDTFNRFELFPNVSNIEFEKAFGIYGILVIPSLLGALTMYLVFGLRGTYFLMSFLLLILILINIFIFYKRTGQRTQIFKLIIDKHYIQMINQNAVLFQANLKDISIEQLRCGTENFPAIRIQNEAFQSIIIAHRANIPMQENENTYPLSQPDYWVRHKREWNKLQEVLGIR